MLTASDVAAEIIRKHPALSGRTQLLKILYYAQAWSLAWTGRPLFVDTIEAWDMGPVVRNVWAQSKSNNKVSYTATPSGDEAAIIEAVTNFYGKFSGKTLINMTHEDEPWVKAYNSAPATFGIKKIDLGDIRKFFAKKSIEGSATPKPPPGISLCSSSPEAVSSSARAAIERWSETLSLLEKC